MKSRTLKQRLQSPLREFPISQGFADSSTDIWHVVPYADVCKGYHVCLSSQGHAAEAFFLFFWTTSRGEFQIDPAGHGQK